MLDRIDWSLIEKFLHLLPSSVAHQRKGPGEGWGWTSLCSAASISWLRSWSQWRWDLWLHWWVGPREWCTFQAWCHSWAACTPPSSWCTSCPPLRVSPPKARPSHYWCTFREKEKKKKSISVYFTSRTHPTVHALSRCRLVSECVDLHGTDRTNTLPHTVQHNSIYCFTLISTVLLRARQTDRQTDRQRDRHWPLL